MNHDIRRALFVVLFAVLWSDVPVALAAAPPTEKNVRYSDKFDRSVFDFAFQKSNTFLL